MTEEIIIDKEEFWDAFEQHPINAVEGLFSKIETIVNLIKRLEQENKDFETLAKSLYKRIEELEKENEALAFRERLYKADYEASEQENKELKEKMQILNKDSYTRLSEMTVLDAELDEVGFMNNNYRSALEEIKTILDKKCGVISNAKVVGIINEVLK